MADLPFVLVLSKVPRARLGPRPDPQLDPQLALLRGIPHAICHSLDDFAAHLHEAAAIFHWTGSRDLLRSVFLASPAIRWVHSRNAGLDNMLFPELVESPVLVTNSSGTFSQSLGEFALAMVLYFAKDFPRMLRNKQARRWEPFDIDEIAGQMAGIVGYGDIGRAVARRLHAMGMKVLALKRHPPAAVDPLIETFYKPQDLAAMLARCDYVVVSAPLTAETRHMISTDAFAAMKPCSVLINVGRGPVVDQAALVRALSDGKIRGAGLDVFEREPIPADDPIWSFDNVFISPHTADHARDWLEQAVRFFLKQYERFRKGEPLENVVDKHLGY